MAGFQISGNHIGFFILSEKFKEGHPEVQKVKAQLEQLRKARQARATQILERLDTEYAQLRKREGELRAAMDAQKTQAANQSRKAAELDDPEELDSQPTARERKAQAFSSNSNP